MSKAIKLILAALFFACLLRMPYGYYQFVRVAAMVGFAALAYFANERKQTAGVIIYIFLAILFQPLVKIALGRHLWNIVDVIVGIGLIASMFPRPPGKINSK